MRSRQQRIPRHPPVVVLSTKLEVAEDHGDVGARHDKDDEHQHQETEHVVVVAHPQRLEDEEHFDEHRAVREDATNSDGEAAPQEPGLVGDLCFAQCHQRFTKKQWGSRVNGGGGDQGVMLKII